MRILILIFLTLVLSACGKCNKKMTGPCCTVEPVMCSEPHYQKSCTKKKKAKKRGCHKKHHRPKPKC